MMTRNNKWLVSVIFIVAVAVPVLVGASLFSGTYPTRCGGGQCQLAPAPDQTGACPAGCTKPCCGKAAPDATKKRACADGCTKPCCADKAKAPATAKTGHTVIDTNALKTLIRAKTAMVILDARGPQKTRIAGAVPMSTRVEDQDILKTVTAKDTLVVTYCGSVHCPLSRMLAKRLEGLGYKNVLENSEGIKGWTDAGGEVETIP